MLGNERHRYQASNSAAHLGVTRSGIKEVEVNIEERIKCARRT